MTKSTCAPVSKSGRLYWAESAACLFWCCNDITVDRFNPCPILPRPFVYALSSLLGEEGRIMQRNNGAPLCQLAPIRRTYRLCQNRRRPNCSSMPLTWEGGVLYKRPQYSGTRHSTARCVIRPEGGWECLLYIWQHGSSCEESQCLVWGGGCYSGVKGEQRGATLLLKATMTCSSGVTLQEAESNEPRAGSNMLHVTARMRANRLLG